MGVVGLLLVHTVLAASGLSIGAILFFMRRRRLAAACLVVTPVLLLGWYELSRVDRVAALFYPEDTQYSSGFSETGFRELTVGVSREAVVRILGTPFERRKEREREFLYFTRPGPHFKNYWVRVVVLKLPEGTVIEKSGEFYTD